MNEGLNVAVLTVSDTRTHETDTSGQFLEESLLASGHQLADRAIVIDDIYQIRARLSSWIADTAVHAVLVTGGTGFSGRDSTPEAVLPLFDKTIEGLVRSSVPSVSMRLARLPCSRGPLLASLIAQHFCMPGSTGACRTAWNGLIKISWMKRIAPVTS